jgi:orotidine-5'-phosphate decarboxylase
MASSAAAIARQAPETARDRLIVALDVPDIDIARDLVRQLRDDISFYKIGGHLLFTRGLVDFIEHDLVGRGKRVFLDLKSVDIGETMRGVASRVAALGVEFLTVMGTRATIEAARQGKEDQSFPKILVVTLLTDHSQEDMRREYNTSDMTIDQFVVERTRIATKYKADGVISSPLEVPAIRAVTRPDFIVVTPGIRPVGTANDDQKRVATPAAAITAGADHLVVGRPIVRAKDPQRAALSILNEMQAALDQRP